MIVKQIEFENILTHKTRIIVKQFSSIGDVYNFAKTECGKHEYIRNII